MLTINGKIKLVRRCWHSPQQGSLVPVDATLSGKKNREAADRLLKYVMTRRDMINYPEFAEHGW